VPPGRSGTSRRIQLFGSRNRFCPVDDEVRLTSPAVFMRATIAGHTSLVSLVSSPSLRRAGHAVALTGGAGSAGLKPWGTHRERGLIEPWPGEPERLSVALSSFRWYPLHVARHAHMLFGTGHRLTLHGTAIRPRTSLL